MSAENRFRGRLFGGFNRQDVVNYLEKSALLTSEYKASKEALEDRCDELSRQLEDEKARNEALVAANSHAEEEISGLRQRISSLEAEIRILNDAAASKDSEIEALKNRLNECGKTISSYESSKDRIAILELNATRRAVNIEKAAEEKAENISRKCLEFVNALKLEYEKILEDTESTAAHIRGEMDRLGNNLYDLTELLSEKSESLSKLDYIITHGMED